jgi:hypothetical protein
METIPFPVFAGAGFEETGKKRRLFRVGLRLQKPLHLGRRHIVFESFSHLEEEIAIQEYNRSQIGSIPGKVNLV